MIVERTIIARQDTEWTDWRWQQRSAVRTSKELYEIFSSVSSSDIAAIARHSRTMRFQATRYFLSLIGRTRDGAPEPLDPLWRQIVPANDRLTTTAGYRYDGTENWELPEEMVTPIAQRKYEDRVIIRASNVCHAYCQFCYEALRTLEKDSEKSSFNLRHWQDTIEYLREHEEISEVILSGGEPLMQSDSQLRRVLGDLRELPRKIAIRIHTRALAFNPFRITGELCEIFDAFGVNSIGLHVTHSQEISPEFERAIVDIRRVVPVLFANIPLLRGVNDSTSEIHDLSMKLYMLGVARGYLYHFMPHSPGAERFRTPVQVGVDITRQMKRRVSNLAVPEFVLPHHTGKHTMPLLGPDDEPPRRGVSVDGEEVLCYVNWRGEHIEYPDPPIAS
jgi:lysine 2,3-aminomutase